MRHSHIAVIGAPLDLGAGRRGVDMGPSAVRVANLNGRLAELGYEVEDLGNVPVVQPESHPEGHPRAKYLPQIADTCTHLAEMVMRVLQETKVPLFGRRSLHRHRHCFGRVEILSGEGR